MRDTRGDRAGPGPASPDGSRPKFGRLLLVLALALLLVVAVTLGSEAYFA